MELNTSIREILELVLSFEKALTITYNLVAIEFETRNEIYRKIV